MTTRILFIVPNLESAGDLTELHSLQAGLSADQYDLHGLTFSPGRPVAMPASLATENWTTITRRTPADLAAWWQFRRYLRRLEPHIIHFWQPLDDAWTMLLTDVLYRGTIVLSLRDPAPSRIHHPNLATQLICKRPYQFITTTACLRNELLAAGMPEGRCVVIPATVPIEPVDTNKSSLLSELGLPAGSRLIGSLNPMHSWKQIKNLIWITAVLRVATDDIHLVLNGHGSHRDRLQQFARQTEIQQHVHWIDSSRNVNEWLPKVDCYASTTRHLGHSVGLIHAMSAAIPITALDCPGNRELIVSDNYGRLTPVDNCGAMARALWTLLGDASLARQLGQQARSHLGQLSTIEGMVQRHHQIYQSLPIGGPLPKALA